MKLQSLKPGDTFTFGKVSAIYEVLKCVNEKNY